MATVHPSTMKIYVNCMTVNVTNCTILQASLLYNIRRKGQETKPRPRGGHYAFNLSGVNLYICTLLKKQRAMVILK